MNNPIIQYVENVILCKQNNDEEGLAVIEKEAESKQVSLSDVGSALFTIIDDLIRYVDASQALTEIRLRAIVAALSENAKEKIMTEFIQAEDDLFLDDKGDEQNGN